MLLLSSKHVLHSDWSLIALITLAILVKAYSSIHFITIVHRLDIYKKIINFLLTFLAPLQCSNSFDRRTFMFTFMSLSAEEVLSC